jgi:hypothetical protein
VRALFYLLTERSSPTFPLVRGFGLKATLVEIIGEKVINCFYSIKTIQ